MTDRQYLRDTGGCNYLHIFINGVAEPSKQFNKQSCGWVYKMVDDCRVIKGVFAMQNEKCIVVSAWVEDAASFKRFIDEKF